MRKQLIRAFRPQMLTTETRRICFGPATVGFVRIRHWDGSNCRLASSSAAVLRADDDEEENRKIEFTSKPPRSRLAALRNQLQDETKDTKIGNAIGRNISLSKSSSKSRSAENPTSKTQKKDLRALVEQLPEVPAEAVLTDSFARKHTYLRLSLTERCNLRCTYCMPEAGVPLQPPERLLQTPELLRIASFFRASGVSKFRLTGGEPSLRKDLLDVIKGLKALDPHQIGMTTNGIQLKKQLPALVDAGLDSINISLDTVDAEKFGKLTRRPAAYLDRVWKTLEEAHALLGGGRGTVKLNCVVMRGVNDNEIENFIKLTNCLPDLAVRFIEYMPFTENGWNWEKCVPYKELLEQLPDGLLTASPITDPHDTTKWFHTAEGRRVGFITSMSSHFCAGCNRLRLSADGQIKVCLFDGHTEISLRDALRDYDFTEEELGKLVHHAVQKKKFSLGGHRDPQDIMKDADNNRPMTLIGG